MSPTAPRLLALALALSFVVVAVFLLWAVSWNRSFQIDEVEHVHAAYNVATGRLLYEDFHQAHNPLLYTVLAPLVDPDDPVASFHRARSLTTVFLMVNVALVAFCAWRLTDPLGALLAAGLAASHTTLVERGMEVRTDGPMSLCVTAALAVELSEWGRLRKSCVQAFSLSLAFLFTNKAAFACFAFGCLWLWQAVRRRRVGLVALPMAAWSAPLLVAALVMAAAGNLEEFFQINVVDALGHATQSTSVSRGLDLGYAAGILLDEARWNVCFSLLALFGAVCAAVAVIGRRARHGLAFTLFLASVLVLSLFLNPFPFPYLHVTALPTLAILAAFGGVWITERLDLEPLTAKGLALGVLVFLGISLTSLPRLVGEAAGSNAYQLETLGEVERVTTPDDAVFDMAGLYFRPDGHYVYLMTGIGYTLYRQGVFEPIPAELRRRQVVAYVLNYRIRWLEGEDAAFLDSHYVHYDGNLFLMGRSLDGLTPGSSTDFEVLKGKDFRYDGDGVVAVDGKPFRQGFLAAGWHRITRLEGRDNGRLIMETPPPIPSPPRPPRQLYDLIIKPRTSR